MSRAGELAARSAGIRAAAVAAAAAVLTGLAPGPASAATRAAVLTGLAARRADACMRVTDPTAPGPLVAAVGAASRLQRGADLGADSLVESVQVEVDLRRDPEAPSVRIWYRLRAEAPPPELEIFSLDLGREEIRDPIARVDGERVPLSLRPAAPGRWEATIVLAGSSVAGPEAGAASAVTIGGGRIDSRSVTTERPLSVELRYRVEGARTKSKGGYDYRIPLILPRWRAAGSPPDFFTAEALLAADRSISESFPTVTRQTVRTEDGQRVILRLQTVPSLVRYRVDEGAPRFFTMARGADLLVLLLLAGVAALSWHALRRDLRSRNKGVR